MQLHMGTEILLFGEMSKLYRAEIVVCPIYIALYWWQEFYIIFYYCTLWHLLSMEGLHGGERDISLLLYYRQMILHWCGIWELYGDRWWMRCNLSSYSSGVRSTKDNHCPLSLAALAWSDCLTGTHTRTQMHTHTLTRGEFRPWASLGAYTHITWCVEIGHGDRFCCFVTVIPQAWPWR